MAWDPSDFHRRVADAGANDSCLACGNSDLSTSDARYCLIELDDNDRLASELTFGMASGIFCGARVCPSCGYVHLHAMLPLYPEFGLL